MKTLFLVRHAKSCWEDPVLSDIDRPLNKRGKNDAPLMAKKVKKLFIKPDLLVSSPAKRALTTAQYFAEAMDIKRSNIAIVKEIYEALPDALVRVVHNLPHEANTAMLFGHNPSFTMITNRFTESPLDNLPTCGVVKIESTAESWADFNENNSKVTSILYPKKDL
jgi:phosphohistidine phosphatase